MNIKSYEYILAIGEAQSLSAAASKLNISQPTLSSFLTKQEEELGCQLFLRQNKQMIPTEAGIICIHAAKKIVAIRNKTFQSIASVTSPNTESFTIGITPQRGSQIFSILYSEFLQKSPNTAILTKEGYMHTLVSDMKKGQLDLVLGSSSDSAPRDHSFLTIKKEEILLAVPREHPLAAYANPSSEGSRAQMDIRACDNLPFILGGSETTLREITDHHLSNAGLYPTILHETNNIMLIDQMLQTGIAVGFLPSPYAKAGTSLAYFSLCPRLFMNIGLAYNTSHALTLPERYFIYLLIQNYQKDFDPEFAVENISPLGQQILREFGKEQ